MAKNPKSILSEESPNEPLNMCFGFDCDPSSDLLPHVGTMLIFEGMALLYKHRIWVLSIGYRLQFMCKW